MVEILIKIKGVITNSIIESLKEYKVQVEQTYESFSMMFIQVENLNILKQFDFIEYYELNDKYEIQSNVSILPNIRINKLKAKNFLGGQSLIGVIDSGMNTTDLIVNNNIICSKSSNSEDAMPNGKEHGTAVGQIIKSIAPWSQIVNLKVADNNKDISKSSILKALEYVYTNDIRIVNMSLGRKSNCDEKCMVCSVVNKITEEGFVVVVAIGNYGKEGIGVTGCPGNAEKAFSIGAVNQFKQLADYSSMASEGVSKPNVLAPGSYVINRVSHEGTSFAAPFITGMIAAATDKFDPNVIVDSIIKTAKSLGLSENKQGNGLVHIEDFLEVLKDEENVS